MAKDIAARPQTHEMTYAECKCRCIKMTGTSAREYFHLAAAPLAAE
jgi:hypothetical protein